MAFKIGDITKKLPPGIDHKKIDIKSVENKIPDLSYLKLMTIIEKGDKGFVGMFKSNDGDVLRIDIDIHKIKTLTDPIISAKVSVKKAATDKFEPVNCDKQQKSNILAAIKKTLPKSHKSSFLESLETGFLPDAKIKTHRKNLYPQKPH